MVALFLSYVNFRYCNFWGAAYREVCGLALFFISHLFNSGPSSFKAPSAVAAQYSSTKIRGSVQLQTFSALVERGTRGRCTVVSKFYEWLAVMHGIKVRLI